MPFTVVYDEDRRTLYFVYPFLRISAFNAENCLSKLFTSLAFPPNSGMNVCGNSSQFTRLTGNKEEVRKEVMRIWLKIA
jgi:hypothetical protein